jgi:hypothetical protein
MITRDDLVHYVRNNYPMGEFGALESAFTGGGDRF